MEALDVAGAPALRHEPAARAQGGEQALEQAGVVGDPVEHRVREHRVHRPVELELGEVCTQDDRAVAERRPGVLDHRRGRIHRDQASGGQALEEQPGHPARAAAGVENGFVAPQRQPLQQLPGPLDLRLRDSIVGCGVPVARAQIIVVTGPARSRSAS
jgi:hypothetical protein